MFVSSLVLLFLSVKDEPGVTFAASPPPYVIYSQARPAVSLGAEAARGWGRQV